MVFVVSLSSLCTAVVCPGPFVHGHCPIEFVYALPPAEGWSGPEVVSDPLRPLSIDLTISHIPYIDRVHRPSIPLLPFTQYLLFRFIAFTFFPVFPPTFRILMTSHCVSVSVLCHRLLCVHVYVYGLCPRSMSTVYVHLLRPLCLQHAFISQCLSPKIKDALSFFGCGRLRRPLGDSCRSSIRFGAS
jgi:hypothetical protein